MPALPIASAAVSGQIVITASRAPEPEAQTPASVTIIDRSEIERLGQPLVPALLRLAPSVAVASSGPLGSFAEVRIRGAENNHTLLFIDGIRANDPATGDFARFELLNADLASRIEVLRGPQSALWGSDAIGGVVAVNGVDDAPGYAAGAEAGSFGFRRANASGAVKTGDAGLSGAVGWQRSTGIDSFGAPGGDKDGYGNLSGRVRGAAALGSHVRLGAAAFAFSGRTQFDGYDPITFEHTDTLDNTRNRLAAGRIWAEFGGTETAWSGRVGASLLGSSNRNYLASDPLNRTSGLRRTIDAQLEHRFSTGQVQHQLILAAEAESEKFHARGLSSGLSTDQDRSRAHQALTAEWIGERAGFTGDFAVRRDFFNRFKDATTLRAAAQAKLGGGFALAGSYAEGMAQPTFFDLYGTFPNNFVGNPNLRPETSRGFEGSLRFRRSAFNASLTAYRQRLHHEIVDVFDLTTFLSTTRNSTAVSHRSGIEAEIGWQLSSHLRVGANYAFLHATQPDTISGLQVRERRRPKHSGSVEADGTSGRWSYGGSVAYAGSHLDTLEVAPFGAVRVKPYWLADARVAYALKPGIELFARGSNLFDASYQEVAGYHTEGRGLFAGIKLADRRSSP
jgi:vitamin B12 transporter